MNVYELKKDIWDNKYFRMGLYPFVKVRKYIRWKKLLSSKYPEEMRKMYNIHDGKRCFIIGNGPSLTTEDLNNIVDEYTFGVNKIYNLYSKTKWRPTYYICIDTQSMTDEILKDLSKIHADKLFFNWTTHKIVGDHEDLLYIFNPNFAINVFNYHGSYVSENCEIKVGDAMTVTFTAIQLAIYLGFKEIYLLGVDFNYPYYKDAKGKKHYSGVKESHFAGGSYNRPAYLVKETNEYGYKVAKKYCEEHGIIIKNLTRGGCLEVFERDSLEKILGTGKLNC